MGEPRRFSDYLALEDGADVCHLSLILSFLKNELRVCINHVLSMAHDIAIGADLKLFWQLALGLWFISYIGSLFNFLTLVYIGVLLCFSVPLLYDKHQDLIDGKLYAAQRIAQMQYRLIDEHVLGKTPST